MSNNVTIPDPFGIEVLNNIFKASTQSPELLNSRESGWLEFKEKFSFGSLPKYAKTMAAFANSQGGYIVFGIKNQPHKMMGINEDEFNSIDPEKLTRELNEIFSPEIRWDINVHHFSGKSFGIVYAYKSENKPVVARKNSGDIKEAEVYYRYRGRSEKIKYPELVQILDERRKQEQQRWMQHLERISKVGVENSAVLDVVSGEISGIKGQFLIDENLLPKIQFIKTGQFDEKEGAPALKLIGDVQPIEGASISPIRKIYTSRTRGIRAEDIIIDFLEEKTVDNPLEYIKQICWESSANLPVYHYIYQTQLTLNEVLYELENIKTRSVTQSKLMERLSNNRDYHIAIPKSHSKAADRKREFKELIIKEQVDINSIDLKSRDIYYFIQAIATLSKDELNAKHVLSLLKAVFNSFYTQRNPDVSYDIRTAICHVDILMKRDQIKTHSEDEAIEGSVL